MLTNKEVIDLVKRIGEKRCAEHIQQLGFKVITSTIYCHIDQKKKKLNQLKKRKSDALMSDLAGEISQLRIHKPLMD
jgi:5'-3' exonuclease